ncbi:MAG: PEP-CTERM system TPR-repeat protein PrsT [Gammaproteobacteria bacterium]
MDKTMKIFGYLAIGLAVFVIAGCDSLQDVATHLERGKQYRQEGNYNSAIIELKNVLKQEPDHKEARYLLGTVYLATGDGASAQKELQKARDLGYTAQGLKAALAKSLLIQGKYDEALAAASISDSLSSQQKTDLQILRGDANLGKGNIHEASAAYEQALALNDKANGARVGLAKVSLSQGDLDQAEQQVAPIDEQDDNAIDMLLLKGEIASKRKQLENAETFYRKAYEISKKRKNIGQQLNALSKLSFVLIANNKPDEALENINKLLKAMPQHPLPKYLRALLAYTQKDYDTALENLQQVIVKAPNHLPSNLLLGAVQYAKGNYEQANRYLTTFVDHVPTHIQARTLLGLVRLKLNKPDEAQKMLDSAAESSKNDARLLATIGKAATASGDVQMGVDFLKRARKAKPDNPLIRAELAKVYLKEGAYDSAIDELKDITGEKADQAKLLLVYSYLRKKDFDGARSTVKEMLKQQPKNPAWWTVSGSVEMIAGDRARAREHYHKALQLAPEFAGARLNLAKMALEDGDLAGAEEQFDKVLANDNSNINALLGMAQVAERRGNSGDAVDWLEKARQANNKALLPRLILARYYYKTGNADKSLAVAREAADIKPGNVEIHRLVAASLLKLNKPEQALETYQDISKKDPSNPLWQLELANVYQQLKDYQQARAALDKALTIKADYLPAKATLATIDLRQGKLDDAMARAERIIKDHPDSSTGHMLVGDIYAQQKKLQQAQQAYIRGFDVEPSPVLVNKIFLASGQLNNYDKAIEISNRWLKKHPGDTNVRMYLALSYQALGQTDRAQTEYRQVLKSQPNHLMAINNMAYLLIPKDLDRAREYAARAYKIAPDNFAIMDTYGWVLAQGSETERAVPILQKAVELSKGNPSVRFHLAAALAKQNERQQAVSILEEITGSGQQFPELAAAKQLLQTIQ